MPSNYVYQTSRTGKETYSNYTKAMRALVALPGYPEKFIPRNLAQASAISPTQTLYTLAGGPHLYRLRVH